jgi:integrase
VIHLSPEQDGCEMGRRRTEKIGLPEGVHRVRAKGRVYYYWRPGRGTDRAGEAKKIHGDPFAPVGSPDNERFWRELNATLAQTTVYPTGCLKLLIDQYRADDAFTSLADPTRKVYSIHLDRFAKPETWGQLPARQLTPPAVKVARDALRSTPRMANQMLSVGRTLYAWAIPLGLVATNPFAHVGQFDTPETGHIPWPDWAVEAVLQRSPEDLQRMVRLGIVTCQRESDLVRIGPLHREALRGHGSGVWCRPRKTRRRRRSVFIPLAITDALELDLWAQTPIRFENSRWKLPIKRHRSDLYLYSPRGVPYTPTSLRARWHRWLGKTEAGIELSKRWRIWITQQVTRYEWDIDAASVKGPTIHGLRGTGVLARWAEGFDVNQIANDVGMSRQTVEYYMRFKDQMGIAAEGRSRLKLVTKRG